MQQKTIGGIMLISATLIWGTSLVAQSIGTKSVGPFTFNAVRFLIGACVLLPLILITDYQGHRDKAKSSNSPKKNYSLLKGGFICGSILFVTASLQQAGIAYTTVGKAGFITSLYIIIVPILERFRGKRIDLKTWGCILLATVGMYLLCIDAKLILSFGDTLVLLCAFTTSIHILAIDFYSSKEDCIKLSCLQFSICGLLSIMAAFMFEHPELQSIMRASIPILYTGILSCGIAYTLQTSGQKELDPVAATLILSLESVFSALCGWIVLRETLNSREIVGCTLMFLATITSQTAAMHEQKHETMGNASVLSQINLKIIKDSKTKGMPRDKQ
ncbi:MAG: DMT family transporter [Spirochaetia bacterium]|jgi:drug/metabolite transporter (DMT)-like permease|nr:DMT family transporter [Spirochaetia bacterium]